MSEPDRRSIDWSLTTWDGSRREQLRRAARLNLRERLGAGEEMGRPAGRPQGKEGRPGGGKERARRAGRLQERQERRHGAPARVREPGVTDASRLPAPDPLPPS